MADAVDFSSLDLLSAIIGGFVGSGVTYLLTKRSEKINAAYARLEHVLGEQFTTKRLQIHADLREYGAAQLSVSTHAKYQKFSDACAFVLNYFDMLLHSVDDGVLHRRVIRHHVWGIIQHDYDSLSEWIAAVTPQAGNLDPQGKPCAAFPKIQKYRALWAPDQIRARSRDSDWHRSASAYIRGVRDRFWR